MSIVQDPKLDEILDELSVGVKDSPLWQLNANLRRDILRQSISDEIDHTFDGYDVEDIRLIMRIYC